MKDMKREGIEEVNFVLRFYPIIINLVLINT
jgi:hypothetical protein